MSGARDLNRNLDRSTPDDDTNRAFAEFDASLFQSADERAGVGTSEELEKLREENERLLAEVEQVNLLFEDNRAIYLGHCVMTPVGLKMPDDLPHDEWEFIGEKLKRLQGSLQWMIGDWVNQADRISYGDHQSFAEQIGFRVKTIYEYAYVARQLEFSIRMENLSFGHHQLVAGMDAPEQKKWLEAASKDDWSVAELRKQIKASQITDATEPLKMRLQKWQKKVSRAVDAVPEDASLEVLNEMAEHLEYLASDLRNRGRE